MGERSKCGMGPHSLILSHQPCIAQRPHGRGVELLLSEKRARAAPQTPGKARGSQLPLRQPAHVANRRQRYGLREVEAASGARTVRRSHGIARAAEEAVPCISRDLRSSMARRRASATGIGCRVQSRDRMSHVAALLQGSILRAPHDEVLAAADEVLAAVAAAGVRPTGCGRGVVAASGVRKGCAASDKGAAAGATAGVGMACNVDGAGESAASGDG